MCKYLLFFLLIPLFGNGQIFDSLDIYDRKEFKNQTLKVFSDSGLIQLQALKPNLIKVSFSKKDNVIEQDILKLKDSVYVRITQNLESIFMHTDSLLIVINKIDYSIKFQNLKEELYTENKSISFADDCASFQLSKTENEEFYTQKRKMLKAKNHFNKKTKSIYSSKEYQIYFDHNVKRNVELLASPSLKVKFCDTRILEYYFSLSSTNNYKKESLFN